MKPGKLTLQGVEAEIDEDGWRCPDARVLEVLEGLAPMPATTAGTPWVQAFWAAVNTLGAEVVQEPEPDEPPADRVH